MWPNEIDFLARKEHFDQLQRKAEHERLVILARLQQPDQQNIRLKLLGWIGGQLIQWGLKLQQDKPTKVKMLTELAENTD